VWPIPLRAENKCGRSVALRAQGKTIAHKGRQSQTTTNNLDGLDLGLDSRLDLASHLTSTVDNSLDTSIAASTHCSLDLYSSLDLENALDSSFDLDNGLESWLLLVSFLLRTRRN
jgi:hypothetical protein